MFRPGWTGEDHITKVLGSARVTRSCLMMDRTFPYVRRTVACAPSTEWQESQNPDATLHVLMDSIHMHIRPSGERTSRCLVYNMLQAPQGQTQPHSQRLQEQQEDSTHSHMLFHWPRARWPVTCDKLQWMPAERRLGWRAHWS